MASITINHTLSRNPNISFHPQNPLIQTQALFNFKPSIPKCSPIIRCAIRRRPEYTPSHIPDPNYIRIFDTTLRDGEQSPGATMTTKEKLDVARQLAKLGVDIIEAGFPASSEADLEAVKLIAKEVGNGVYEEGHVPVICGLARCNKRDIDKAWEAVKYAKKPRIHTFIATSEIHMKFKLKMSRDEVVEKARSMVAYARSIGCEDVEFSPEDAGRSDPEFLYHILGEVIKAGATTLNIPDTVGYTVPSEFGKLIADIKANTPGIGDVIISTHCQNDLGLSTANTLAGACAGARQVEVTINGIGERAGNASLEEVVMALKCRGEQVLGGLYTGINTQHILMSSKMVEEYTGLHVQPHKAIVGANAFAHESGIHQDGMLKHKDTYEIISPEDIGLNRANESGIVLGKLSGRHALQAKMLELGYDIEGKELEDLFWRFKSVAEKKKKITDDDLIALMSDEVFQPQFVWQLENVQVTCGSLGLSTATVKLIDADGQEHVSCSVGTGPVDAAYKAVDLIVKVPVALLEYSLNAVTEGIDAIASTRVLIRGENGHTSTHALTGETVHRSFSGTGADMDIVISSVRMLHSKECMETCNFSANKKEIQTALVKGDEALEITTEGSSLLVDDVSKYQLTREMRWSTGKEATKAIADFALVVQHKRSKLCKRNNGGSNKKYVCSDEECLWFVQLSKGWKSKNWKISAMNLKHSDNCTGEAKPTARQLAELRFFRQAVVTHSKSSGALLTDNFLMNSESGIKIPRGLAYRAQRMVVATSTDDLTESYKFIPSLIESFARKNPDSIVNYEKDIQGHFIRAFVMPNSSMAVLADQQQICGIHVLRYDTVSYQGYMALLITRDGNFEYQVMAFVLLPTNEIDDFKWFITLAKRGGARFNGGPVFCSHSEHGLLRALAHEACNAKIMFCVSSLLEEMARDKNIPALGPLEEKVWELQQQESEEGFLKILGDLEALNSAAAAFLRAVHPKNWAYYLNQSVRLYGWASTGADKAVAGSDIQRNDEAPFDLIYTFLAFLMDKVFKKNQVASKVLEGQPPSVLTPGADAIYQKEREDAARYTVRRCDEQVAFAWLTGARPKITYRMDLALRTCTCGRMFQLGLPCRHYIAASMHFGNESALLDSFDPIYKATTYAEVHRNLRIEIPAAGDLYKDESLLPAISTRSKKSKKRPRSGGRSSNSAASSTSTGDSLAAVSTVMSISNEDNSAPPLAKTPRLDFDSDVVNSLSEIV